MNSVRASHLDRTAFRIGSLDDGGDEREFWRTKSPTKRMEALELMRQIIYG